jgi:hypothetical protein
MPSRQRILIVDDDSEMRDALTDSHYRLRQKIEKDAAAPAILVTEAGGYKLVS